jgi:excisionase family DNA binding protein
MLKGFLRRAVWYLSCKEKKEKKMSELLTVTEVAHILRVNDTTVRRWVKRGALPAIVLPHVNERQAYRVRRSTLDKLLGNPPLSEIEEENYTTQP